MRDLDFTNLPKLTANAKPLELDADSFGLLRASSPQESNDTLRSRQAEDGYLYVPGLLDVAQVKAARAVLVERLVSNGLLDPSEPADRTIPAPGVETVFMPELAMDNEPLSTLLYAGPMMEFYEGLFGEAVLHYDFTWLRAASQGKNASPHCDIVYMGRGTFDVLTGWTPLANIGLGNGPLMVLEGSHLKREALREYLSRDVDTYCANGPNAARIESGEIGGEWDGALDYDAAALRRSLGGRWLTSEFAMGDLLTFTMGTVHASIDNLSKSIRLSSDSRYQRASEPADERWIGPNPIAHGRAGKRGRIC
jgi:ectoine hydroxylase-related dioxygenase (phytanoyl-CoA dioxygenase family)